MFFFRSVVAAVVVFVVVLCVVGVSEAFLEK